MSADCQELARSAGATEFNVMRALLTALLCLILLIGGPLAVRADEDGDDQDEAREAVEGGEAIPLAEILSRPDVKALGEIVAVRLLRDQGRWEYQLRLVDSSGKVREVRVEAGRTSDGQNRARE
jgi:uncharacterized membrane protein YkoI